MFLFFCFFIKNFEIAGDYVFINIPAIAKFEWHPFTISSAPELKGFVSTYLKKF